MEKKIERINGSIFDGIKFVITALNPKDQYKKAYVTKIYATDSQIMATDGKRLHVIDNDAFNEPFLEPGYWEVIKNTKSEIFLIKSDDDSKYPNIEKVIPTDYELSIDLSFSDNGTAQSRFYYDLITATKRPIQYDYIAALPKETWKVSYCEDVTKSIRLDTTMGTRKTMAVIMPIIG